MFLQCLAVPKGRKVGCIKRRVRGHLAGWAFKKCTRLRHKAHVEVKFLKAPHVWITFGRSSVIFRVRHNGFYTFTKVTKHEGFAAVAQINNGSRETFEEDEQRRFKDACRAAGAVQETSPSTCLKWGHFGMILLTYPHLQCLQSHLVTLWWRRR